jgi:hypothetical protein
MAEMPNATVAWSSGHSWRALQPHRQGTLDRLCGLYAAVNAIRLLHEQSDAWSEGLWTEVFDVIVRAAEARVGMMRLMLTGIDRRQLRRILGDVAGELPTDFGIPLRVAGPFKESHASVVALRNWLTVATRRARYSSYRPGPSAMSALDGSAGD